MGNITVVGVTPEFKEFDKINDIYEEAFPPAERKLTLAQVPYERNSIENYYCNVEANYTFNTDRWQLTFSNKCRVQRMMTYYWPVMSEEQALRCLQQGNFGMEYASPQVTDWSCVYNPKQGTLLFNMRDDLSEVYFLNVYEELRK